MGRVRLGDEEEVKEKGWLTVGQLFATIAFFNLDKEEETSKRISASRRRRQVVVNTLEESFGLRIETECVRSIFGPQM